MSLRLPVLAGAAVFLSGLAVLVIPHAQKVRGVVHALESSVVSAIAPLLPNSGGSRAQDLESEPILVDSEIPAEAASLQEVRIAAIRNGVRYGWIQLPRGTRVEIIRAQGDWTVVRYGETHFRVHRAVIDAGLVTPRLRAKPHLASL